MTTPQKPPEIIYPFMMNALVATEPFIDVDPKDLFFNFTRTAKGEMSLAVGYASRQHHAATDKPYDYEMGLVRYLSAFILNDCHNKGTDPVLLGRTYYVRPIFVNGDKLFDSLKDNVEKEQSDAP